MKEETIQFKQNKKKKRQFEKGDNAGQEDEKGKLGKELGTKSGV